MKAVAMLLVVLAASGCAITPQEASVKPEAVISRDSIGQGTAVALRLADERPSKSLGNRGSAFIKGAEIRSSEDIAATVKQSVHDGLLLKGFTVTDYWDDAPVALALELRSLEYSTSTGFWTGGVKVNAAIKAIATRNGRVFEQMYRTDKERRVVFVPGADANEAQITTALQEVIEQIFNDAGLMGHLAGQ